MFYNAIINEKYSLFTFFNFLFTLSCFYGPIFIHFILQIDDKKKNKKTCRVNQRVDSLIDFTGFVFSIIFYNMHVQNRINEFNYLSLLNS